MTFSGTSTAGNGNFTSNPAGDSGGFTGTIAFSDTSTAGNGTFTNNGAAVSGAGGGVINFQASLTAANGTFIMKGGTIDGAGGGVTQFLDDSIAGNGTFIMNGAAVSGANPGAVGFRATTAAAHSGSAGDATLIANGGLSGGVGGLIFFENDSLGGTARVELFGNGNLDISFHDKPGVRIGSIKGNGVVFLGANNLTVGSNNLSTTFSGVIQDGPNGGVGGSLAKIGRGTLVVTNANTYTGGTTIHGGTLVINNTSGSGTGSGAVLVKAGRLGAGRLGGTGTMAGAVTVGEATGSGAILSPGFKSRVNPGTLTVQSTLTFNSDATYEIELNSSSATADKVVALGVTINSGAQTSFADLGSSTLPTGTVFTVIDNTAATPIAGTFSNLADGSTFTNNGNTYQVDYEGGDGNDLTLTVVP